ncbi:MAG: epoxyqueuosine reductase QueH [Coriobacteriales bacterium]|jgi:predicted adenine nucleotide alpha hydrolase (AANH) superfamily ATPase|nr:epoxyqueuosine reductase QueH [Coriobacteriales bacterium]
MTHTLLHICCAPCSTVPLAALLAEGTPVFALFENSNIHPAEEHERRWATFASFAENLGIGYAQGAYDPDAWDAAVGTHAGVYPLREGDPALAEMRALRLKRCRACYAFRFERLAAYAAAHGFDAVATTLSISPYQFTALMAAELAAAAARHGIASAFNDYRASYPESVRRSRSLGMYRQNHCGCRYSAEEAALERAARKASRKAGRETPREAVQEGRGA